MHCTGSLFLLDVKIKKIYISIKFLQRHCLSLFMINGFHDQANGLKMMVLPLFGASPIKYCHYYLKFCV